jgi:hypothetical protein
MKPTAHVLAFCVLSCISLVSYADDEKDDGVTPYRPSVSNTAFYRKPDSWNWKPVSRAAAAKACTATLCRIC